MTRLITLTLLALMSRAASYAAGTHSQLAQKTGNRTNGHSVVTPRLVDEVRRTP